uniref:Ubiquitin-like domain-containing protein n=1 Tax=Amphiprion ocellaris TaxID=80972 RepID=A0A3Q1BCP5_AMPOC
MEQQQEGLFSFSKSAACGPGGSTGQTSIQLSVTSTTGSPVELTVPRGETVEGLRTRISHRLRLQTHRIALLHKDRHLTSGKLLDLGVTDGSKLTLVPVIEAGLMCSTARAERTMMDVLESLTEAQINDFLSGRSPLTISLGIGAHMMYVQLQLSAQDVKKLHPLSQLHSQSAHTSPHAPSTPSLPSGCPHPSSPLEATAPVCLTGPSGSSSGPPSPVPASTFTEVSHTYSTAASNINASSHAEMLKEPGAVIESFVNHSPGVFSGTFSGTLPPCSQSGISHPRRGIAIILQILNDLLRAAYHHQGAPAALPLHPCPASNPPVSPLPTAEEPSRARIRPPVTPRTEHLPTENQTMHCKLEHLQLLMHQRRLRRRTRRSSHVSQTSHPYQHRHYHP